MYIYPSDDDRKLKSIGTRLDYEISMRKKIAYSTLQEKKEKERKTKKIK